MNYKSDHIQTESTALGIEAMTQGTTPITLKISGYQESRHVPIHFYRDALQTLNVHRAPQFGIGQTDEFEGLLLSILAGFVNLPAAEVDGEIQRALERVCSCLVIDRAAFWRNSTKEPGSFSLTHHHRRYARPGEGLPNGSNEVQRLAEMQIGTESGLCFPWITAQVRRGKTITFSRPEELPEAAAQDKASLARFGTRSAVIIPFLIEGEVLGVLSFASSTEERIWPELFLRRLEIVAQVFADARARKLADEALTASMKELMDLKAALDEHAIVTVTDAQGRITAVNDKFCEISKYSREELLGHDHPLVNAAYHSAEFLHELWTTLGNGKVWRGEIKSRAKDGTFYWAATTIVPFVDRQGRPRQYVAIRADITERKKAEEALNRSYAEIKQLKDRLQAESDYLKAEIKVNQAHGQIIGRGSAIRRVLHQVEQVALADCAVLINGETGTGKELIAEEIHRLSARRERVMVLVNCAALPSALVESELFGRERGAYTGALTSQVGRFEVANGSTIFLDEIGELSMEVQAKLLRVLQEGEFQRLGSPKMHKVNVRVIAATNRDLAGEVRKGKFREDLYYRLKVFPIEIPPLRERPEDIALLVFAFMEEFSGKMGKRITKVPRKAMEALQRYSWPGNIRELRNVIEHSVILSAGEVLKLSTLGDAPTRESEPVTLAEAEREHILRTLESTGWRIKGPHGAAQRLDLHSSTLYSRMQKLGIPHRRQKDEREALQ